MLVARGTVPDLSVDAAAQPESASALASIAMTRVVPEFMVDRPIGADRPLSPTLALSRGADGRTDGDVTSS